MDNFSEENGVDRNKENQSQSQDSLQLSTKRARDATDSADDTEAPEYKISKSSLKLKKFDGRYICQFCDKTFSFKMALGKHQEGKHGYKPCDKMQEHDKWVPADCKEHHWRRDASGNPLGPADPNVFQKLTERY